MVLKAICSVCSWQKELPTLSRRKVQSLLQSQTTASPTEPTLEGLRGIWRYRSQRSMFFSPLFTMRSVFGILTSSESVVLGFCCHCCSKCMNFNIEWQSSGCLGQRMCICHLPCRQLKPSPNGDQVSSQELNFVLMPNGYLSRVLETWQYVNIPLEELMDDKFVYLGCGGAPLLI